MEAMKRQTTNEHLLATNEEQAVIGTMLLAPKSFAKVAGSLTAKDFFDEQARAVFQAVTRLHSKNRPVDHLLLLRELAGVEPIGGEKWASVVARFAVIVPYTGNLDWYMRAVKEASRRREIVKQCERCVRAIKEGTDSSEATKELLETLTTQAKDGVETRHESVEANETETQVQ